MQAVSLCVCTDHKQQETSQLGSEDRQELLKTYITNLCYEQFIELNDKEQIPLWFFINRAQSNNTFFHICEEHHQISYGHNHWSPHDRWLPEANTHFANDCIISVQPNGDFKVIDQDGKNKCAPLQIDEKSPKFPYVANHSKPPGLWWSHGGWMGKYVLTDCTSMRDALRISQYPHPMINRANMYLLENRPSMVMNLDKAAMIRHNIKNIDTEDDLSAFHQQYKLEDNKNLQWDKVVQEFNGIYISTFMYTIMYHKYPWLDGWDVESLVIWDKSIINKLSMYWCQFKVDPQYAEGFVNNDDGDDDGDDSLQVGE
jgi:hypothetical protein